MTESQAAFIAILVSIACTANARIGETLEECVERYGEPLIHENSEPQKRRPQRDKINEHPAESSVVDSYLFSKGNYDVAVFMIGGKEVDKIQYAVSKQEGKDPGYYSLSEEEIESFLSANKGASTWERDRSSGGWITEDKSRKARIIQEWGPMQYGLQIEVSDYNEKKASRASDIWRRNNERKNISTEGF